VVLFTKELDDRKQVTIKLVTQTFEVILKKIFLIILLGQSVLAQSKILYPFQNTYLSIEERVNDLASRLTLREKISQMVYNAPAIERLGIPEYNWWNECLHGVARNGRATVFPQAIGLAATWNKELIFKIGNVISDEARAKYNYAVSKNQRGIYQGLTFWSPNINILRDPRWGRGQETYGEDPYLTGQIAVQFIRGLQGDDPKYLKLVATSKHFAVHSGPEPDRHSFDAEVSEYDLRETYLPAFKTTIADANVQSVMCAYNSLRGNACCGNDPLLNKILRDEWKFAGYVVSDCWAIKDIWEFHKQAEDVVEASALAVKAGTDLNCGVSFPSLFEAYQKKLITEDEINNSFKRLFTARMKLGMFDPSEIVPYSKIDMNKVDSKEHRQVALQTARESIVLLKNEKDLLPLKKDVKSIAVIGPNAEDIEVLLGNYTGFPSDPVTPLRGIKNKVLPLTKIYYEPGCDLVEEIPNSSIIPASCFFIDEEKKQNGLAAEIFSNPKFEGKPLLKIIDNNIDFWWLDKIPFKNIEQNNFAIRWQGYLVPPKSGEYKIGGWGFNGLHIYFEDLLIVKYDGEHHPIKKFSNHKLEKGKAYKIRIDFYSSSRYSMAQLFWSVPDDEKEKRAIEAAKKSDVVIMFMGISPRLEGEELEIEVPGFYKGDRRTLDLPETQKALIKKIAALGKPVVLVLLNGSALSINWEKENILAIVEAWYGGQSAGDAIADVLFGDFNPSGKLPITFYKSVNQLPDFKSYDMRGRTYRYFDDEVLYPFGHGLSYTSFQYSNIRLEKTKIEKEESTKLFIDVKNVGQKDGGEVVQFYVKGKGLKENDAIMTLKGFEKIFLKRNEQKTVTFEIKNETLQRFTEGKGFTVEKGNHVLMVGSSSRKSDLSEITLVVE
jgi:beta-glucosidase